MAGKYWLCVSHRMCDLEKCQPFPLLSLKTISLPCPPPKKNLLEKGVSFGGVQALLRKAKSAVKDVFKTITCVMMSKSEMRQNPQN